MTVTFGYLACHTQVVERLIHVVADASASVIELKRDGYIRNRLVFREKMPRFSTKSHFVK